MWTRRSALLAAGAAMLGVGAPGRAASPAAVQRFAARRFPDGDPTTVRLVGVPASGDDGFDAAADAAFALPAADRLAARMRDRRDAGQPCRVLVKPAVNSRNAWPYTASPRSVAATCRWLLAHGATDVIVADMSGPGTGTADALDATGIGLAALDAGARLETLEDHGFERYEVPAATTHGGSFELSALLDDVDFVVNIARASTHKLAQLTLSLKNWQGLASWRTRRWTHTSLGRPLTSLMAEYSLAVKPDLVVIDAGTVNTTGGPDGGLAVPVGALVVAEDMVAADLVALGLLRWAALHVDGQSRRGRPKVLTEHGAVLWNAPVIGRAVALGVGVTSPDQLLLSPDGLPADLLDSLRRDLERVT